VKREIYCEESKLLSEEEVIMRSGGNCEEAGPLSEEGTIVKKGNIVKRKRNC
jgi:hypothetical protein